MIKHIVMWKVKAIDGRSTEENVQAIKAIIDSLKGKIPGMLHIEGGVDFSGQETSADVVLYSEFESRAALDGYQTHPAHLEIVKFIGDRRTERRLVDYEV